MARDILASGAAIALAINTPVSEGPFQAYNSIAMFAFWTTENTDVQSTKAVLTFGDDHTMTFIHPGNYLIVIPSAPVSIVFTNYGSGAVTVDYALIAQYEGGI